MFGVRTFEQDGSMPARLTGIGAISKLRYASAWPFGCTTCSFDLDIPVDYSHYGLKPGRLVEVYSGIQRVWGGTLQDPLRGTPWTIQATGAAALADDYLPLTSGGTFTADPTVAVDQAIARGLPWIHLASDALPASGGGFSNTPTLTALLNAATAAAGTRWSLFDDRHLTVAADPTAPSYVLIAADTPGSRTVDTYVTDLYVTYYNNATTPATLAVAHATTTYQPFGRLERTVDITSQGAISTATAQANANAQLAASTGNLSYTGQVTVQQGALLNPGGVPVDLSTVRAGRVVQARGVSQDPAWGNLNFTTVTQWVIGECEYDVDERVLRLMPMGAKPNDLTSVLAHVIGAASA